MICFSFLTSGLIPLLLPSGGVDETFEHWVDIRLVPILPKHLQLGDFLRGLIADVFGFSDILVEIIKPGEVFFFIGHQLVVATTDGCRPGVKLAKKNPLMRCPLFFPG